MGATPIRHHELASAEPVGRERSGSTTRARRLLEDLRQLATDWLQAPLKRTLDDFCRQLFETAENARSGTDLQSCMDSREKMLQARTALEMQFITAIGQAVDHVGELPAHAAAQTSNEPLSLVIPAEQEVAAVLGTIAARGIARGGTPLFELGYRLAALVGAPPLEGVALPLGPHALTAAFYAAITPLELPDAHNVQLLASFDRTLIRDIAPLYEKANEHLLADGILPQLHAYTAPARLGRSATPKTAANGQDAPQRAPADGTDAAFREPIAVLDSLRELLAQRRPRYGRGDGGSSGPIATADELQTALGALQQHFTQVTENVGRELRSTQRLRREILAQINANQPAGAPAARLSEEQDDTIELVAGLFEQLGRLVRRGGTAHTLLHGLQVPMLRLAMVDHDFFEQREHPARRLLGAVTRTANDWLDSTGGQPDSGLSTKLEQLVSRAAHEPPSADLYSSLLADIEQHLNRLNLRAQAVERRHVEAMQSHERLQQARARAGELIAARLAKSPSPPHGLLRVLLDRAWTDVLMLTLLRHGEHDPACITRLAITDQLLGLAPVPDRQRLQGDVQAGLRQIGMAEDEALQVAQRLVTSNAKVLREDDTPSSTELAMRLKQHQRLGTRQAPDAASAPQTPKPPDKEDPAPAHAAPEHTASRTSALPPADHSTPQASAQATIGRTTANNAHEVSIRRQLAEIPFGTWFEFIEPGSRRITQRKLAWYSPMSGRALFVNRRGQRSAELSLDALAHAIAGGRARKMPATHESMLERAWRNLADNLRRDGRTTPAVGARS